MHGAAILKLAFFGQGLLAAAQDSEGIADGNSAGLHGFRAGFRTRRVVVVGLPVFFGVAGQWLRGATCVAMRRAVF